MKKKHVIFISIFVILIIASIATMFILKDADNSNSTFDSLDSSLQTNVIPEAVPDKVYDNIANSMGITREELDEIITTPLDLTDEQKEAIAEIISRHEAPDISEFIEDENPNDNIYTYIDTNGDTGEMIVDIPEFTDEENEEYEMGRQAVRIVELSSLFYVAQLSGLSRTSKFLFQNFIAGDLRSSLTDPLVVVLCGGQPQQAASLLTQPKIMRRTPREADHENEPRSRTTRKDLFPFERRFL